jgi:diguanylate cyclase (GGDEF)-like protein/PAS domain S-box-containing protein
LSDKKETLSLLQEISDFLPGVVYQYRLRPDGTSCFPYSSAAIRQIYRVTPEEVREDSSKVLAILHPDDLVGIEASIQKSAAELIHWNHEYRVKFEDGTERWLMGNALPSKESDGSVLWNGFITDITERKQADLQKSRLSRALMLLSESNLMLSQSENEHDLMTAVCKLAVETGGYLMAWIGFAENDEAKSIRWVAQSGYEDGYLDSIKVTWSDSELGQGPAGTSIKTGLAVANQDYQNSPQMAPWREAAMRRGYRSSIALPLIINHHVFGVFSTYAADPFAFSDEEIVLLEKLAGNLSYGIEKLRTQVMLQESNEKIRAIFEGTLDGIVLIDAKTMRHITSNPAFSNMLGYSPEEIANFSVLDFHRQQDLPFVLEQFEKITRGEIQLAQDIPVKRKDSSVFYVDLKSAHVNFGGIDYLLGNFRDISERKAAEEAIKELAFFDPLTKLSNRRLLQDRLFQALSSSDRSGQTGALLFIDLDNFKTINETLGHAIGDQLLQEVAKRLKTCIRVGDTLARLGGDEFVVMLEGLNEQTLEAAAQVEVIGEKILSTLDQPYCLGENNFINTPSIGIALFSGLKQGMDDLFKQADIAMYQAKKDGRNTLRFFDPKMQEAIDSRSVLENELRLAIEHQQFQLYYQIQVDGALRPLGAESLIRWIHPQHGLVSPVSFIPIAEETGLILPIGSWVIDTACSQLRAWQMNAQTQNLILSVNVSAKQFRQVDFVSQVEASIQNHGIIPRMLKLELTESLLLEDITGTIATMSALKAIGVQFSLDDFGTGYSSLQYLKKLPLNEIKIDQSFVRDITSDQNDAAIVQTIIAMAATLGFDVIAEGVETEAQREFLMLRGCHTYQGYLFGKPMPIEQLEELIHQR